MVLTDTQTYGDKKCHIKEKPTQKSLYQSLQRKKQPTQKIGKEKGAQEAPR